MWKFLRKLPNRQMKTQISKVGNSLPLVDKASPDEMLGELFQDVQMKRIYPDGMTFVDLVPAHRLRTILRAYKKQRQDPHFDLAKFTETHFRQYVNEEKSYRSNPHHTPEQHIKELWHVLTRETYLNKGSLLALPYPYIVPGGRFGAQWYWDSYFTMLGLAASDRWDLVEGMVKNFAFMIRKYGYIPSGNRTYYLSRSQPPFFVHMVHLLAQKKGKTILIRYLPYILAEYSFWMKGAKSLRPDKPAYRRVVRLGKGEVLNRYYDNKRTPRPEMYRDDVDLALIAPDRLASKVYVDIRAAAESGWDFSSRWFKDAHKMSTIHTTDLIPVDLNCLLVQMEQTIADTYRMLKQPLLAGRYQKKANARAEEIRNYCWSPQKHFFFDYDFVAHARTEHATLAGVFPLYAKVATQHQADLVAQEIKKHFLKEGGVLTTLKKTGEQWDAPNGWAPLHWVTIQGLRNYGHDDLANEIKRRWIATNIKTYAHQAKMVEKYNVQHLMQQAGGGEYPLQDGFGWTNGVLMALLNEDKPQKGKKR